MGVGDLPGRLADVPVTRHQESGTKVLFFRKSQMLAMVTTIPSSDGLTVTRDVYGPGNEGSEVVLYTISGGGHTWPGQPPVIWFIGKSTTAISANDLMWEFFQRHPMR